MINKEFDENGIRIIPKPANCEMSIAPNDRHLSTISIFDKNYFKENQAYEIFDGIRANVGILRAYSEKCLYFIYSKNRCYETMDILLSEYELNQYVITRLTDVEGV